MARKAKAGWHVDPANPARERYWDGGQWTGEGRDAPPPARKRRGGTFLLKVVVGAVVGSTVLIGGCAALLGAGLNSTTTDGITRAQFDAISQGTSQASVEQQLGQPDNKQDFEQKIPELQDHASKSSCVYYAEKGKKVLEGQSFQLCFDEGQLTSKNAY